MNDALASDTRRLITHLTETGFAVRQAKALANEVGDLLKNPAPKIDLAQVETTPRPNPAQVETTPRPNPAQVETTRKADLARIETAHEADLARIETAHEADLARIETARKADLAQAKYEFAKWMANFTMLVLVVFSVLIAVLFP